METNVISLDVGSSSVRASIVSSRLQVLKTWSQTIYPQSPAPHFVEYNGDELLSAIYAVVTQALEYPCKGIAIANQRASTAVWHRSTGELLGPVISWMDLRTAPICLDLSQRGISIAPNQSASKLAFLLSLASLNDRSQYCFGTLETYVIWHLTQGGTHKTDHTNAAMTGIVQDTSLTWDPKVLDELDIPRECLPEITPSCSYFGEAILGKFKLPILGAIGDQQASLLGQGCSNPGDTKITFGTATILDQTQGDQPPASTKKSENGTFPIVAYSTATQLAWATEAIALGSGSMISWLLKNQLLHSIQEANQVDRHFRTNNDLFVIPANNGLGTPEWDFGARTVIAGLSLASTRQDIVSATLDSIANLASDLLCATELDSQLRFENLQIDGGMTDNPNFLGMIADAVGIPIIVASVREATTIGAAALAFEQLENNSYIHFGDHIKLNTRRVTPEIDRGSPTWIRNRNRWLEAKALSYGSIPELTKVKF